MAHPRAAAPRHVLPVLIAFAGAALAGAALAADREKAEKSLKDALAQKNADGVQQACDALIEAGGEKSLDAVLALIAKAEGSFYWQLVGGASGFKDRPALEELGKQILARQGDSRTSVARDLLFGLQNNASEHVAVPLGSLLEKGRYDLQLMAADQLAASRTVDAVDALVAGLRREEKGDPELRHRILASLVAIVGEDQGDMANWEGWWKSQRPNGVPARKTGIGVTGERPRLKEWGETVARLTSNRVVVLAAKGEGPDPSEPGIHWDYDFDHMQEVLLRNKIPHRVVARKHFEDDPEKYLKEAWVVLSNCHQINEFCACTKCKAGAGGGNRLGGPCQGCNTHIPRCYRLKRPTIERLKSWVENEGGYLYTEDWGLIEITGALWPDLVVSGAASKPRLIRKKTADGKGFEPHSIVGLTPSPGRTSHPLMRGVWQRADEEQAKREEKEREKAKEKEKQKEMDGDKPKDGDGQTGARATPTPPPPSPARKIEHRWRVDDESPAIEVKDTTNVIPLLESEELGKIDDGFPVVAVTFRLGGAQRPAGASRGTGEWATGGGGRVLHTLSHFGHQSTSEDGRALENLIVNFLLEAEKRRQAVKK